MVGAVYTFRKGFVTFDSSFFALITAKFRLVMHFSYSLERVVVGGGGMCMGAYLNGSGGGCSGDGWPSRLE